MSHTQSLHKNEKGQAALETAIILIAFVVVASVFAFAILSAGSASTDKGKAAINAGLAGVQSSMAVKGSVSAKGSGTGATDTVTDVVVDLSLVAGGDPVDLTDTSSSKNVVVVTYRDGTQVSQDVPWTVKPVGKDNGNSLLETGETAEMDIDLSKAKDAKGTAITMPGANTAFTIEIKPPTGAVIKIDRTTPAAIADVMDLK